ncbi:MAG TPA: DUF3307 domain-containing protein [Rhizobiaceae bacterium]|nr:DUF3307 domain-containing protein [Rhizobiaceae bacterium]
MALYLLLLLSGLQIKHFVADYLLQTHRMIMEKASFRKPGGYLHVAIHAVGTLLILLLAGVPLSLTALLVAGEAIAHYLIDYGKANWSCRKPPDIAKASFWAAHGADQLLHQLTYTLMIYLVLLSRGG